MGEDFITLEIDDDGCGRLQLRVPLDIKIVSKGKATQLNAGQMRR